MKIMLYFCTDSRLYVWKGADAFCGRTACRSAHQCASPIFKSRIFLRLLP
jgi:hypothetical protein